MILNITTKTFDLQGLLQVKCDNESTFRDTKRRVSKVATLDGGVSLVDMGYTDSDMQFDIKSSNLLKDDVNKLTYLMTTYPRLHFATMDGYFEGVISNLKSDVTPVEFTILVKEKLAWL